MILFGLEGGIGNAIFCLPAIKALACKEGVSVYVGGDYPMVDLFSRCTYVEHCYYGAIDGLPKTWKLMYGQYAPAAFKGLPSIRCGWNHGQATYPHSEWEQVKLLAVGNSAREDVSDWIAHEPIHPRTVVSWDFGIVPGCKPGPEWQRKKYPGMKDVAAQLRELGFSVAIFGQRRDSPEPLQGSDMRDCFNLQEMPEQLRACKVIIGTDSGITHLAASLGVPCVVLFTATCPTKGDPVATSVKMSLKLPCAPCQSTPRWKQCIDWRCREIVPSEVVAAAVRLKLETAQGNPGEHAK